MNQDSIVLETRSACFGYGNRRVIDAGNIQLRSGRCMGIFGPNGAGKTTLIRGLSGLIRPISGQVQRHDSGLSRHRFRFGYIPQQRAMDHHWPMTGLDAASMASSAFRLFGWMGRSRNAVIAAMKSLGADEFVNRPFAKLSGGQQQRILLAGAIAADPTVLILDEPADGLDVQSRKIFIEILNLICSMGVSVIIISHQIEDLLAVSHEIAWLHPAASIDSPTTTEIISPQMLCERIVSVTTAKESKS